MKRIFWNSVIVVASLLPASGYAQAIDCNSGVDGEWIAGDQISSNAISFMDTGPVDLNIVVPANGSHVALFEVEGTDSFRIEAISEYGDTVLELRNENGLRIAEDDDSGGNGNARIETILDPGIYCVVTTGYDGTALEGQVRVGMQSQEPLSTDTSSPYCDTMTSAVALADGAVDAMLSDGITVTGSVDEAPYYRFTLETAMPISLSARNEDADPVLYLFGPDGTLIMENDDYDGLDSRIDISYPLDAGDYCVGLRALNDTSLPITVNIFAYDEAAIMAEMYDRAEAAPPMDGTYPITDLGPLGARLRNDVTLQGVTSWFSIDVEASGLLVLEGIAVGDSDPYLVLFDDVGRELARNDDSGMGYDSLIATKVFPGTYLVGVTEASGGGTGTVRLVVERYVPAE